MQVQLIVVDKVNGLVHGCEYMQIGGGELCKDDFIDLWGLNRKDRDDSVGMENAAEEILWWG